MNMANAMLAWRSKVVDHESNVPLFLNKCINPIGHETMVVVTEIIISMDVILLALADGTLPACCGFLDGTFISEFFLQPLACANFRMIAAFSMVKIRGELKIVIIQKMSNHYHGMDRA